jgi:hypothetical protein
MKWIFVIAALSLVIFSSGCTVPGLNIEIPFLPDIFGGMNVQEQRHDVISIESLDAIPSSTVRSGQSIRLRAVVKNLQQPEYNPVDNVEITLYNDCGLFEVTGDFCANSFESDKITCKVKMYPQSTSLVQWKLDAKEIKVETPCNIGIMARYSYTTYSTASVTFVNKAELERLVTEGKSFSETGTLSIGEGPVKPYIEVLNQPIVIDVVGTTVKNRGSGIMSFWLENKGSGIIGLKPATEGNVYFDDCTKMSDDKSDKGTKICLSISGAQTGGNEANGVRAIIKDQQNKDQTTDLVNCIKERMNIKGANGAPTDKYGTNFIGKKTPEYPCSITVEKSETIKQESTYQITADVSYFYKFTKEIAITVQPQIKL